MKTKFRKLCLMLSFLCGFTCLAQESARFTEEQKEAFIAQAQENKERLQLSAAQEESYLDISVKYAEQMKQVKDSEESRLGKYKQLKSIRDAKNKEMKALLSDSQYDTYLEIQKERKEEFRKNRKK